MGETVLVTGGTGFVAGWCLVELLRRGFSGRTKILTPLLGRQLTFSAAKARRVLGFAPRPVATTIVDCAESLVRGGHVPA